MGSLSGTQIFGRMLGGTSFLASPTWVDRSIVFCWWKNWSSRKSQKMLFFNCLGLKSHIIYIYIYIRHMTKYDQLIHLYMDFPWHKPWHSSVLMAKSSMDGFSMRFLHEIRPCQLLWYSHFRTSPAKFEPVRYRWCRCCSSSVNFPTSTCASAGAKTRLRNNDLDKNDRLQKSCYRLMVSMWNYRKNLLNNLWVTLWWFNIAEHGQT